MCKLYTFNGSCGLSHGKTGSESRFLLLDESDTETTGEIKLPSSDNNEQLLSN